MTHTVGVIVAGGEGRRLALDGPKALARIEGRTLLDLAIAALTEMCDAVVVALSPERAIPLPADPRVSAAYDAAGTAGPLAGLVAGLRARPFGAALVLGVDFPLVSPAALRALLGMLGDAKAVVPAPGGIPQPLCGVYAPAAIDPLALALASGERSLLEAMRAIGPRLLSDAEIAALPGGARNLFNLNTPEDLAEAARQLREAPDRSAA